MNTGARVVAIAENSTPADTLATRTYIVRADVTYSLSNVILTDPTTDQLLSMRDGDVVTVRPPRAKCDQWLELHAHFPHTFTYRPNDAYNVAKAIRDIEVRTPCHGAERASIALFGDTTGRPYTGRYLNSLLRAALTFLYGDKVASMYTWHSYRSGLAVALHAAGVPDPVIMLICHWVCDESLRSYRRISHQEQESVLRAAASVPVNLLQPRNAPVVDADLHYAAMVDGLQLPEAHRHVVIHCTMSTIAQNCLR